MRSAGDIVWLTERHVRMLHAETINLFGGSPGVRDATLLESAIGRARNLQAYDETASIYDLAAAYGFGIARNHPFIDGNKRTALLGIRAFLFRNGYVFEPGEVETVTMMEGVAAGDASEDLLSDRVERSSKGR